MRSQHKAVIVVGAGISGLSAAYFVREQSKAQQNPVELAVFEAQERPGGVISTTFHDGFVVENGPDSFLTDKPWALALAYKLGLENELIGTREESRKIYVVRNGRLIEIPEGFYLLGPAKLAPLFKSRALSLGGKLRAALDLALPRRSASNDESVGSFVKRRLGQEVLEYLVRPLVQGIYGVAAEQLSLRAATPRFAELEQRYRSVILGLRAMARQRQAGAQNAKGARLALFVSFRRGMATLVEALTKELTASLRTATPVVELTRSEEGWEVRLASSQTLRAPVVILAIPPYEASRLLAKVAPRLAGLLKKIPYGSATFVTLAYRADGTARRLEGSGFVVPQVEGKAIAACTFSSIKFAERAPDGHLLVRVFIRDEVAQTLAGADNYRLIDIAQAELRELLGIRSDPKFAFVQRHFRAMPQYLVGHLERVQSIERELKQYPGLLLAGGAYRGLGIPDCVRSAEEAARMALESLARLG